MLHTKPTPEEVDCRYCTEYSKGECKAPTCPYLADRIEIGAVGYLGIPTSEMNELLESIVSSVGINRDSVVVDRRNSRQGAKPQIDKKNLLSVKEYQLLNFGKEYFEIPIEFDTFEFENNEIEYWPVRFKKIYFRQLALRDPAEHDWVLCAITRTPWFKDKMYIAKCIREGKRDTCSFTESLVKVREELLFDALINKANYRAEMQARIRDLKEMLVDAELWPSKEELLKGA